ncbi:GatB/YqeY domain-containing protein [Saccharophagus degradans]|uniref:GatB/Yqey n=2 Tax=Saccharophagus degradans TaxID=86304 RepID=Q21MU9_SACD2|nr:GatB/YqeY domain-containing protein [Saccharophagus degradans]ABD79980.1 GatB/Yqey [Saccharophagus degradans 2-40]MBU2984884.1 GatB/YqeY domain-containing protein [Saccharophagus degradans]MDO6423070.1 GatB/YqeY domain-containing protein [Saccharophagus degradans]MDO6607406.1 GatB/YqeY domain-containing protein [Saccharophagus degradans]WGO97839.1 GatB/YqeY domain-containing protein [Saccharophagus degradans]
MASELKSTISNAVKDAMRAKAKDRLGVLRMVMAEFKRIEVDERIELDDARVLAVLDKMVKQRRDSAKQYEEAGREELAATEHAEIAVISDFLPQALTAEEIAQIVNDAIASTGAAGMGDMGKVMGVVKPQVQGRADMGEVSKLVKAAFA